MKARVPAVSKHHQPLQSRERLIPKHREPIPSARLHAMTLIVLAGDEIVDDRSPVS
jgi:hypothetical protein